MTSGTYASWLHSDQLGKIAVGVIIALVVIGALLSIVITKLIARVVILVIVVGLAVFVWQQRTAVQNDIKKCKLQLSFVGIHVQAPQSVVNGCKKVSHR